MKKQLRLLFLLFLANGSFSQFNSQPEPQSKHRSNPRSLFSIDITKSLLPTLENVGNSSGLPTSAVTNYYIHYPRLTIGYNRFFGNRIMLGLDVGFGSKSTSFFYEKSEEYNFIEFRPEIQLELSTDEKSIAYCGFEIFYIRNKDVFINDFYFNKGISLFRFDKAKFTREKTGAMLKFGIYRTLYNSFGVNLYSGLGAQFTSIEYDNIEGEQKVINEFKHGFKNYKKNGSMFFVEFTVGMKLYFITGKSR